MELHEAEGQQPVALQQGIDFMVEGLVMAGPHERNLSAHRQYVIERSRAAFENCLLHPLHIDFHIGRVVDSEAGQRIIQGKRIHRDRSFHGEIVITHVASPDSGDCREHGRCAAVPGEMEIAPPGFFCQGRGDEAQATPRALRALGLAVQPVALALVGFESDGIHRRGDRQQVGDETPARADIERHERTFSESPSEGRGTEDRRRSGHVTPSRCLNCAITRSRS